VFRDSNLGMNDSFCMNKRSGHKLLLPKGLLSTFHHVQKTVVLSAILISLLLGAATAQTSTSLEVTRNVNLRPDASTANSPIKLLIPPESLSLIELDRVNGFYHVRDVEGQEGWVWAKNVKVANRAEVGTIVGRHTISATFAKHISPNWVKPPPLRTAFHGIEGVCSYNGNNGSDPVQFMLKNRADVPDDDQVHDVLWSAIQELNFPGKSDRKYAPMHRKDWKENQLSVIRPFEGVAVRVVGYLVAIKPQNTRTGEGTNCNFKRMGDVDTHLALVERAGDLEKTSVVIEWTPRFLNAHPNWTAGKLLPWLGSNKPVRVTGWLMLDPDHFPHLGKYRSTLWEIHPITKFEVFKDGKFVDLDSLLQ
jgi:hypothetical protein